MNSENTINFKLLLQQWLNEVGWSGDFEENDDGIQLRTAIKFDTQYYDVYVNASDRTGYIVTCIYSPFHVRTANLPETLFLINQINAFMKNGRFAVIPNNRIQYAHFVDFETANPTVRSIDLLMMPALRKCERYDQALACVAVGGQSAAEAIAALDAAESEETPDPVVPEVTSESTMSSALH